MSNPIPDVKNPPAQHQAEVHVTSWTPETKAILGKAMDQALMYIQRQVMSRRGDLEWDDKNGRFIMSLQVDGADAIMAPYLKDAVEVWVITKPCVLPLEGD